MNHVNNHHSQKGFTLIELLLAMTFLSVLLLAIALTIIQISNIYNRGLTLKDVNQTGIAISDELQSTIAQASPFSIDTSNPNSDFISQAWGGRLCTGKYTYVWNYGKALATNNPNIYMTDQNTPIHFVKVFDPGAADCISSSGKIASASATELLSGGDHDLAIHSFTITSASTATDSSTGQQLYTISFILGTNETSSLNYGTTPIACITPGQPGADPTYCVVQEFDIVARAGNGT